MVFFFILKEKSFHKRSHNPFRLTQPRMPPDPVQLTVIQIYLRMIAQMISLKALIKKLSAKSAVLGGLIAGPARLR